MKDKLDVFENMQTDWIGLWWNPENQYFSSESISLAALKKFKGAVRLYVKKNKFYKDGSGRPNYRFVIRDAKSEPKELSIYEDNNVYEDDDVYYTKNGERLYTAEEVQFCINRAAEDGARGYGYGDNLISDYLC